MPSAAKSTKGQLVKSHYEGAYRSNMIRLAGIIENGDFSTPAQVREALLQVYYCLVDGVGSPDTSDEAKAGGTMSTPAGAPVAQKAPGISIN